MVHYSRPFWLDVSSGKMGFIFFSKLFSTAKDRAGKLRKRCLQRSMWCLLHPARICASTARCLARLWSYLEQWLAEPGFLLVFQAAHKTQDRHVQPGRHYQALCTDHPSCVIANLATKHHLQARRNSLKFGWDEICLDFVVEFSASLFFCCAPRKNQSKLALMY